MSAFFRARDASRSSVLSSTSCFYYGLGTLGTLSLASYSPPLFTLSSSPLTSTTPSRFFSSFAGSSPSFLVSLFLPRRAFCLASAAPPHASPSFPSVSPSVRILEVAAFTPEYKVQLTPTLPPPSDADVVIQSGPYRSWWLRLCGRVLNLQEFKEVLGKLQDKATDTKGALYVCIPETKVQGAFVSLLKERGFKFHHHVDQTSELVYYCWTGPLPDMVPDYATSIEGGGLILVSPDKTKVLLVKEYGRWSFPGGATDINETTLETATRECFEEAGARLDPNSTVWLVGGWNIAASRDRRINDHYNIFLGKAATEDFRVDGNEITEGKWVAVDLLMRAIKENNKDEKRNSFLIDGVLYAAPMCFAVQRWQNRQGLEVVLSDWGRQKPGLEFH
eukprot:gb/GEZN01009474.1/.p1 GENE.gb/GEZN01009474.1/~~gb/GEZN01009474.1/.p1  ORF type:complete len:424 (+),score=60.02 gb/GEZN01009474.1/:102-1274(+)